MNFPKLVVVFLLLFSLNACAFAPVERPEKNKYFCDFMNSKVFIITLPQSMDIAKNALEAIGYEILTNNSELGLIRTKTKLVKIPEFCDCGTWNGSIINGSADSTIVVEFQEFEKEKISVSISMKCSTTFKGTNLHGATTRQETYDCASRGKIENEFWNFYEKIYKKRAQSR